LKVNLDQMVKNVDDLLSDVRNCRICADLPLGPRPILQVSRRAKILIAGQAPGRITHHKGIPFDDPSGNRLRDWLGITRDEFYDASKVAIVPMGFCFPGTKKIGTGKGGDLAPRAECAEKWSQPLLNQLPNIELTLIIGQYAQNWHIDDGKKIKLTDRVAMWRNYMPERLPLPHPSPRNNLWLKRNPWFEEDVLPMLKNRVTDLIR
jgi:uracil-DNA glycosylase